MTELLINYRIYGDYEHDEIVRMEMTWVGIEIEKLCWIGIIHENEPNYLV